jgi:hypothetical protein
MVIPESVNSGDLGWAFEGDTPEQGDAISVFGLDENGDRVPGSDARVEVTAIVEGLDPPRITATWIATSSAADPAA